MFWNGKTAIDGLSGSASRAEGSSGTSGLTDGRFDTGEAGGIPSGWSAALKPYDVPPNAGPGTVVLQQIALEVWWQPATGGRRTMRLESYRPQAIPNPQQNMVIQ